MKRINLFLALLLPVLALGGCMKGMQVISVVDNTENAVAREYLETVSYPDGNYDETAIARFDSLKTDFRKDQPAPLVIRWKNDGAWQDLEMTVATDRRFRDTLFTQAVPADADSVLVWNLVPGKMYSCIVTGTREGKKAMLAAGAIQAQGALRMIRTDALHNVRDLGGWQTADGRTLKYGLLFRGGQMNRQDPPTAEDVVLMKDRLGIKADVDLRWDSELNGGTPDDPSDDLYYSPLGEGVEYAHMPVNLYALEQADTTQWNNMLNFVLDHVIEGKPCYIHCAAGADRTGTTCFLLEGLLGVPEESLSKDYELTSYSTYGRRHRDDPHSYRHMITYLLQREGDTLRDKFENYFTEYVGISQEKIDAFRAAMLD